MLKTLIIETFRGKTLPRILMNLAIKDYTAKNPVKGQTIDLGSKSNGMSYNRFLSKEADCKITYTDMEASAKDIVKLNLEEKFKTESGSYDSVMCFNTMEHIFNFKNIAEESYRILKKDGIFIGSTPFLICYHADPDDYFRYTHSALERIFKDAGFEKIKMQSLGIGHFSTGLYQVVMGIPKVIRPLGLMFVILMDKIFHLLSKASKDQYALSYFFVFKK
ncbi:MAG: methyltransferase domain-containing protein [Candidatus Gracilibacteria bacterium]